MAKRIHVRQRSGQEEPQLPLDFLGEKWPTDPSVFDRRSVRCVVSILLLGYLAIVLLGPLSNPVGSEFLTRPLARVVAPVHRTLFLGHGYRFFGPDPGPSHMIVYRFVNSDGDLIEKRFPQREQIWPRLLYHRWFMLSETVFQEHNFTLDQASFEESDKELKRQVDALRLRGKYFIADQIEAERKRLEVQYRNSRTRIDELVTAMARNLMQRHASKQIEMFVQERSIPFPAAVLTGQKISDLQFLSELRKIGEFRINENGEFESIAGPQETSSTPAKAHSPSADGGAIRSPGEGRFEALPNTISVPPQTEEEK
jgi:hypothetical protein